MGRTELSNERWSCTETSNFYSVVAPQSESARYPALNKPVQHLCRTGSGASEVIDVAENIIGTAEGSKSCKLARSRFKGVVAQRNARWGCQIYKKNRRIWLGTFSLEEEAARAYDAAAKRFRGADAITNFKSEREHHVKEMAFLMSHSEDEIVSMLQKHTYEDQLEQISRSAENGDEDDVGLVRTVGTVAIQYYNREGARTRELLFEKTLTHSDVGRLNRLVIPKVLAEKYFPAQEDDICSKDMLMTFQDTRGKLWRFRYSYWKSSQNYVLTKGWFRFVREKNLKAGDVVSFQQSTGWDRQWFIDYKTMNNGVKAQPERVPVMRLFGCDIFKVPCDSDCRDQPPA